MTLIFSLRFNQYLGTQITMLKFLKGFRRTKGADERSFVFVHQHLSSSKSVNLKGVVELVLVFQIAGLAGQFCHMEIVLILVTGRHFRRERVDNICVLSETIGSLSNDNGDGNENVTNLHI